MLHHDQRLSEGAHMDERLRPITPDARLSVAKEPGKKRQSPAPSGTGRLVEAGDGIRTHDIHVGNVKLYH